MKSSGEVDYEYVTSDCWAIKNFNEIHEVTKDTSESDVLAVKVGCYRN